MSALGKLIGTTGLYTDESPGLKVDPFVVMVLSIGFIISVVALHSTIPLFTTIDQDDADI